MCWVWIEEAFEIENEADFEKLDLSVPRGNIPDHLFKQTTLTFNPWSETHWLKSRFFDSPSEDCDTYSTNYLCNEFLDETDIKVFERMREVNPRRYAVAGLGEWGISEGLVYENWEQKAFNPFELGKDTDTEWQFRHFFGLDYGYTNDPTAFIAFAANPITKEIYIYDEIYQTKLLNTDMARLIKEKGFSKERIRADAAEPKSNDDLRRLGIQRIMPSVKGKDSIINGISAIQEYKIYVHPNCKNTLAELSSYTWKKDKSDNATNVPDDKNNHLMDAMRYAFYDVKTFRPTNEKHRKTPDEIYNYYHGIRATDIGGI